MRTKTSNGGDVLGKGSLQNSAPLGIREPKGRSARHLRMTVMMQRQLDEIEAAKVDSHALVAHPPREGIGARKSGVKFRSRSSAPTTGWKG